MPGTIPAHRCRRRTPAGAWHRCGEALGASWLSSDDQHIANEVVTHTQQDATDPSQLESNEEDHWTCRHCGSECRLGDDNLYTCSNPRCSITHTKALDRSPEWRHRNESSDDPARCGMPVNPFLRESSYGCKLTNTWGSVQMRKLGKYAGWQSMPYHEKALHDGFEHIRTAAVRAGLPKRLITEAHRLHKEISEERSFRGVNRQGVVAAALYLSCRTNGCPRTAKEIAAMFSLDPTHTTRGCKNALSVLSVIERERPATGASSATAFPRMLCSHFVDRFASRTGLTDEAATLARFIALKADSERLVPENTPHAVAAGVVWYVCQLTETGISKKAVARACDISEVTVSKCYKKLVAKQAQFLPPSVSHRYKRTR
jgi:transcription initiation factor TFIIB